MEHEKKASRNAADGSAGDEARDERRMPDGSAEEDTELEMEQSDTGRRTSIFRCISYTSAGECLSVLRAATIGLRSLG